MRIRTLVSAAASLALGAGAMATPQESVTFTGVDSYNTASGGSQAQAGQVRTNSFTGAYVTKKIGVTGTLTRVTSGTFASEARVYVIPPTGTPITLQPFTTNGYTGSINVPAGYSASFATPFAMTAGTWNFRFFESAQDAAFNVADSTWTTITMTLDDGVVPPPSPIAFDFGNVDPASGFNGTSGNIAIAASEVKWFAFNLSSGIDKAALSYLDIDTEGSVLSAANDTNMALYNDQGTVVTSDDDDGSGLLSQLTYGRQERAATGSSLVYNGRDGATRAAGVHYLAVVGKGTTNTFGSNFAVVSNSANTGNVQVHIRAGTYPNNLPETVATVTDLGAISTCPTSFSGTLSANEIKWYKFVLPLNVSVANNNFLDIDTNGSVLTPNQFGPNDTFIAVFNGATGAVVQSDDDDGAGLLSALSFGQTTPTRPATGDGVVNNGRDGALNSGTYYFAAAAYPVTYAAGFDAVSTSAVTGTWSVHIKYGDFNIPAAAEPTSAPSLGTFDPASFGPAGGSATGTATTTITGPGQFKWYKIILTSSADASARTWLDIDTEGSTIGGLATATALYSQATGNPVGSDNDDGSGSLSQLSFGTGGAAARPAVGTGVAYDGRDGNLTAGTYYLAVSPFPGSFNAGYNVQNCGSATGNITINVKAGYSPVVTPTPTYTFAAFSAPAVCASSTLSSPGETLAIGGVNWYKLTVPAIDNANGTYLDITTNGSILATGPTFLNDTLIQLYDNTGVAINFDDESGQDSCSALSYGATSPARANGSNGAALVGQNGATRAAGDYYLAVIEYDADAATDNGFVVDPGAGTVGGTTVVNVTVGKTAGSATTVSGAPTATSIDPLVNNGTSLAWTSSGSIPISGTGIVWLSFTAPDLSVARSYLDFDMEGTTGVNTALAIFTSTGDVEDSDSADGTGTLPQLSYGFTLGRPGPGGDALSYNGRDDTLTAGATYYIAVVAEQSDSASTFATNWAVTTPASCAAAPSGTATFRYRLGTVPPPSAPAVDANLGTVSVANSPQATASLSCPVSTFRWVHFKTVGATDAATHFVDIHAYGSVVSAIDNANPNDTEMGLYNSTGTLVDSNDDFTETGAVTLRESVLSYGRTSTVRDYAAHPIGVQGQNGAVLPAGDYYIAIGAFNMTFNAEFGAVATNTDDSGTVMVTIITNTAIPPCNAADIAGLGGGLGSDGILTVDDLVAYLSNFFSGNLAVADLTNLGGGGGPDGLITVDDLVFFLSQFFSPCNP